MDVAAVLWAKHLRKLARSPMEIMGTLFLPVLLVGLFGMGMRSALAGPVAAVAMGRWAGTDYLAYITPGAMVLAALSAAVLGGAALLQERLNGILKQYLVAPIPRLAILLGTVGSSITKAVLQSVLVLLLAAAAGARPAWQPWEALLAVIGLVAFATAFAGLAAAFAAHTSSMAAYHSIIMVFNVPLLFASNALYPLQALPGWLKALALINPTSYAVDLLRAGLFGAGPALGWGLDLAVLLLFAAGGVTLGVIGARRWATPS